MFSPHNAQWVFVCGYQSVPGDVLRISSFKSPTAGVSNHLAELPGMQAFVLAQQHHTPQTEYQIDYFFLNKKTGVTVRAGTKACILRSCKKPVLQDS